MYISEKKIIYMRNFRRKFYESHMSRSTQHWIRYIPLVRKGLRLSSWHDGGMMKAEADHRKSRQKLLFANIRRRVFFHRPNPRIALDISCSLFTEHTSSEPEVSAPGRCHINTRHLGVLVFFLCCGKREKGNNGRCI